MVRFLTLFVVSAVFVMITACSTIMEGETQDITVLTPGASESRCIVDNGAVKYITHPPDTIRISRRKRDLEITCQAYGNRNKTQNVEGHYSKTAGYNVLNGLFPGVAVDYVSGALYSYPDTVVVDFTGMRPRSEDYPAHYFNHLENPTIAGMEEFRHGQPSLMRDQFETRPTMQRRSFDDSPGSGLGVAVIDSAPSGEGNGNGNGGEPE